VTRARRHTDTGRTAVWEFGGGAAAAEAIASHATAGELVYAPPPSPAPPVTSRRTSRHAPPVPRDEDAPPCRKPPSLPRPPDLAPLRAALARRGLELQDQRAYYFSIIGGAAPRGSSVGLPGRCLPDDRLGSDVRLRATVARNGILNDSDIRPTVGRPSASGD
jgi:hypothetical protein